MKTCVLVSGGLDSAIAYHLLAREPDGEVIPVFIDYKQSYLEKELRVCREVYGDALRVLRVDGPKQSNAETSFVPNRNVFFASYVTLAMYPDRIIMGGLADDNVADKTPEVFEEISALISKTSGKTVAVDSILWKFTKGQAVAMFLASGIPNARETLLKAVSCYSESHAGHCGDCPACYRRYVALMSNGIECEPLSERIIDIYRTKAVTNNYDEDRLARMKALKLI